MGKIIWTTIFWALIVVIAGFYLKFMDQGMGQQISNWIMSVQATETVDGTMSGEILDPMQAILSGVSAMQIQLTDGLSGLNMKLDETKTLIEDGSKPKIGTPTAPAPAKQETPDVDTGTGTN